MAPPAPPFPTPLWRRKKIEYSAEGASFKERWRILRRGKLVNFNEERREGRVQFEDGFGKGVKS